ncbi:MAG: Cytochrome c-552 precursor [Verrucomicrobiota bacterium]
MTALLALLLAGCRPDPAAKAAVPPPHPGKNAYIRTCAGCHMVDGRGLPNLFPPLTDSPTVQAADPTALILIALHGLEGPVEVNGQFFDGVMPAQGNFLSDRELAAVVSYIRQEWGHGADVVAPTQVQALRAGHPRHDPWTMEELSRLISSAP